MSMRVGFIGLGDIGRPMAERLVGGGLEVTVFDLRAEAVAALVQKGARGAASCAEVAAASEVVGVCVRDDDEVRGALFGAEGVLAGARRGALIALHSTILPRTVEEVGRAAAERGIAVVDAAITGGAAGAQAGTLTYMVGGDAEAVERCRPVFQTSAARVVHTGPLGSGAATKLCNNLLGYLAYLAVCEAGLLAERAGLATESLLEVTRAGGHMTELMASFLRYRQRAEAQPADAALQARARHYTDLAEKDLAVTLAFARELGVTLPGTALCQQLMARVYGLRDEGRR